jgi:hypothetical protein
VTPAATFPLRVSRAAVFAVVAVALAAGAHVIGGGSAPGPAALLVLGVPVVWASLFLTMARRRWPIVIGALAVVQIGLHEGLRLLSEPMAASFGSPSPMAGHGVAMADMAMPAPENVTGMAGPSLSMVAAHLVATVLTGAVLAHGEQLLWSLWTWLRRSIIAPEPTPHFVPRVRNAFAWNETRSLIPVLVDRSVRRRGPPGPGFRLPHLV